MDEDKQSTEEEDVKSLPLPPKTHTPPGSMKESIDHVLEKHKELIEELKKR
jgi:hypothetical protein